MRRFKYILLLALEFFNGKSDGFVIMISSAMVLIIGLIDYQTSLDISLSLIYLLPIILLAWDTRKKATVFLSFFSVLVSLVSDVMAGRSYSDYNLAVELWNSISKLFFYFIVSYAFIALKEAFNKEKNLARTDSLTGIANQRYFFEIARIEVYQARRYKRHISIAYIDVDNFKHVNDTYGHAEGNNLVILIASTMKKNIRTSDRVARLGGDEFAVLLPETDEKQARAVIEKLQKALMEVMRQEKWPITFSIGVVTYFSPKVTIVDMIKKADKLMYTVKNSGKNKVKFKNYS
jgi:diguanylate cyclase (GGDEF)-like protein